MTTVSIERWVYYPVTVFMTLYAFATIVGDGWGRGVIVLSSVAALAFWYLPFSKGRLSQAIRILMGVAFIYMIGFFIGFTPYLVRIIARQLAL